MKVSRIASAITFGLISMAFATAGRADITGLFSTGYDSSGHLITSYGTGGTPDGHYTVTYNAPNSGTGLAGGTATGATTYAVDPTKFPLAPGGGSGQAWASNLSNAQWISPFPNSSGKFPPGVANGTFNYSTSFTSTGTSATFYLKLSSDDQLQDVKLNGVTVLSGTFKNGLTGLDDSLGKNSNYGFILPFSFSTTSLIVGTNVLTIDTNNTETGAEGLIAQVSAKTVPEPASLALLGIGSLGAIRLVRRSRKSVSV